MTELATGLMTGLIDHRYLVRERLGRGSFGQVYRAEHRVLGVTLRKVAVKLFQTGSGAADRVSALLTEALHAIRTQEGCPDPVIRDRFITCYDAALGERPYLVMELAAGDLAWQVRDSQLPAATAGDYLRQLCQGMAFMHSQGVLHLDLKPGNVLISASGSLKIADFGCAARLADLLGRHSIVGTLAYQAPEVLAMDQAQASADVYALGLICYEMLTGQLPDHDRLLAAAGDGQRSADHPELIRLKLRPVRAPSDHHPGLDGHPLEAVVLRALNPLSTERYPDAGALLAAVEDALAQRAPLAPPQTGPTRVRTLCQHIRRAIERADLELAGQLADEATGHNRELGDDTMVAELYPVLVELALRREDRPAAQQLAREGLGRRAGEQTYHAMALAFAGTDVGRGFDRLRREGSRR